MNKKVLKIVASILVIIILLIVGVILINGNGEPKVEGIPEDSKLETMYQTIIDTLYEEDPALNSGATYIALDLDGIEEIVKKDNVNIDKFNIIPNDKQKENLLNYCKKYNENVMNAGFDELKAQGLFNEEYLYIDGILIYISSIEKVSKNKVVLEAIKYKSGLGAIYLTLEMKYEDNDWKIEIKGYAIS